ncbi:MAG TPA: hypothetical protein VFY89_10225, partial [Ktedonobacterales bacterium]
MPCSSTITKTLAQNADELTVGSSYTYAVHAYVLAKYDAHQPSLYCGPFYGEAEVVNLTTGAAPGGYLEVTFADQNSTAKTSKGTNTP